jgi:hypothetical protein
METEEIRNGDGSEGQGILQDSQTSAEVDTGPVELPDATDWPNNEKFDGDITLSVLKRLKASECRGNRVFWSSYPNSVNQLSDKQLVKTTRDKVQSLD